MAARLFALLALCLTFALSGPHPALAQEQATLISDSLSITGDTRLIADGNVEVFFRAAGSRRSGSSMTRPLAGWRSPAPSS